MRGSMRRSLLLLLLPLACGYRGRSVCQTYLACLQPNGGDWSLIGAEEEYGRDGACWDDPTRRCPAECYEQLVAVPPDVDRSGLCEVVYTPDLLTEAVFHDMFLDAFCRRAAECGATCEIPIQLPVPAMADDGCAFDLASAQACLEDRFAWPCDGDAVGGVRIGEACGRACVADGPPAE